MADIVAYGLLRITEKFDNSDTVKFIYIRWVGESIHRMLRARLGTHSGAVKGMLYYMLNELRVTFLL